jgi:hypothetical protein
LTGTVLVVLITWPVGISLGGNNIKHWSWPTLRLHWVHSRLSLKIHGLSERMMNIEDLWAIMKHHQTISNHQLKTDATTNIFFFRIFSILSASSGASCVANSAILPRAAADVGLRPGIRFKCHLAPASVMPSESSSTHLNSEVYGSMDEVYGGIISTILQSLVYNSKRYDVLCSLLVFF